MAEEKASEAVSAPAKSGSKPILFIILAVFNMLVVLGLAVMIYLGKEKEKTVQTVDDIARGEIGKQHEEAANPEFIGKLVPLEQFLVNLQGDGGDRLVKITMQLEVDGSEVQIEIDKLKPKIRDIIIMIISSRTYGQVSSDSGKDALREEIRHQVNLFLTKGQINRVYFTELLYN